MIASRSSYELLKCAAGTVYTVAAGYHTRHTRRLHRIDCGAARGTQSFEKFEKSKLGQDDVDVNHAFLRTTRAAVPLTVHVRGLLRNVTETPAKPRGSAPCTNIRNFAPHP